MRIALGAQASPIQNLIAGGAQLSARNEAAASYLPSDNPTSLVGWFRMGVGVTSSGGFASAWADQSGNGHDLLQATGTNQPAYDGSSILTFDGVDNFMKCVAFTLNQPTQISMLFNQVTWSAQDRFTDGNAITSCVIMQRAFSPQICLFSGALAAQNTNMTVGAFFAVTGLFSGASSSLKVGTTTETTGNAGADNAGGFTLGSLTDGSQPANFDVKEIILRNVDDATIRADDHTYLQTL